MSKEKFLKAYEPGNFETEIYAAWEASGVFLPKGEPVEDDFRHASARPVVTGEPRSRSVVTSARSENHSNRFSIVMPPPNANGNLHIGHGLTIALEDAMTRYHRLRGEPTWYVPGADHAGFETWVVYERELEKAGHTRFEYSREELYARVWDFVGEQRGNMELQLRALGASCAWKDLTFTLDENVVRRVYTTFEKMWQDGMVYRGEKLVNFCTKHQTAFADIEVEHEDEKGYLWEIAYPLTDGEGEIVVSTTRPETLFGDVAVAVNPQDERYKHLIGKEVQLPLTKRTIPVITDEHANPEYGTGAVKITPAHDFDDFEVGERHDLPRVTVIGFDGKMLPIVGESYAGLSTIDCREKVLADLREAGLLRSEAEITHAVAHCYKCGTVIEPLLKEQWFVDTERLAAEAIRHLEADEIKFFPASKKQVLINYLKGLKDWNISRQIPWGIAIPMFQRADLYDGSDAATGDAEQQAPEWVFDARTELKEIEVGGVRYVRDEDTFDTWFSSAHWPMVCTNWEENFPNPFYPLNIMETGADILFAWVARMIMMGLYVTGEVPFYEVYLHGLVLDAHGKKMSKSKGNVINPMELVAKYGSDAFRLGILRGRSAGMNQAFSEDAVVAGRNLCNKLWNIARFVQGVVDEEAASLNQDDYSTDNLGEDWICRELNECRLLVETGMREQRFAEVVETLYSTIWDKYADWFLESQKLYKNVPLLQATLEMILTMLHPFAPFVTETIWQNLSWTEGMLISAEWPSRMKYDAISAEKFERLVIAVSEVRSTLQALSEAHKGHFGYGLLYGEDALVDDNSLLMQYLCKVPSIASCEGAPRGLRVALPNNELYLDVPEKVVRDYRSALEERILAVGRELDALNLRMSNPRYVERAPEELVEETRQQIAEKEGLIERLKGQLEVI